MSVQELNLDELRDRLHARINGIEEQSIREFTRKMTDLAPQGFWDNPASRNHHRYEERLPHGNVLHTLRAGDAFIILASTQSFLQRAVDIGTSAVVLHDQYKHGRDGTEPKSTPDHMLIPHKVARENKLTCLHFLMIMHAIESHMGKWGPRMPQNRIDWTVHMADAIAARYLEFE